MSSCRGLIVAGGDYITNYKKKDGKAPSPTTQANLYRYLCLMFEFAFERKNIPSNPVLTFENLWANHKKRPQILTIKQAESLLTYAYADFVKREEPAMLVYITLGLFGGVRREELMKLKVYNLRADYQIEIEEEESKTRGFRTIQLPLCAQIILNQTKIWEGWQELAEIEGLPDEVSGLVSKVNFRKNFERIRKLAGIDPWPKNALRHSFASYFFAATKDKEELLNRLGHNTDAITFQHYLRPVKTPKPIQYFELFPDKEMYYEYETSLKEENAKKEPDLLKLNYLTP